MVCGAAPSQIRHGSTPRWENQSLYESFDGKLVLACLHAVESNRHQLSSQGTLG